MDTNLKWSFPYFFLPQHYLPVWAFLILWLLWKCLLPPSSSLSSSSSSSSSFFVTEVCFTKLTALLTPIKLTTEINHYCYFQEKVDHVAIVPDVTHKPVSREVLQVLPQFINCMDHPHSLLIWASGCVKNLCSFGNILRALVFVSTADTYSYYRWFSAEGAFGFPESSAETACSRGEEAISSCYLSFCPTRWW